MSILDRLRRAPATSRGAVENFNSLVAAGQRIDLSQKKAVAALLKRRQSWQEEAFAYWHAVGELKYASRFQGNVLSRAKFFPAVMTPDSDVPVPVEMAENLPSGFAAAALDEMLRLGDFNHLIKRLVVQWQVPGEGYLVGRLDEGEEVWEVASRSQLFQTRNEDIIELRYSLGDKSGVPIDRNTDVLVRLWQEDEQWPGMADSPMHSLLYEIEELLILGRMIRSVGRSRLANGSILKYPSELSMGPGEDLAPPDGTSGAQRSKHIERVIDAFIEPIHDEGAASAVAPIIIEGAYKYLDRLDYMEMPRSMDPIIDGRIDKLFLRFARAWNLPPERMLGMTGTTFANASQVERSEWDAHLAPLGESIGLAISMGWLRSALQERGFSRAVTRSLTIAADPARAITNPTLASDAKDAHKAMVIADETLRRALGFDEGDRPDDEEMARRVAVARGSVDSVLTAELLATLLQEVLGRETITVADKPTTPPADQDENQKNRPRRQPDETKIGGQDPVPREAAVTAATVIDLSLPLSLGQELVDLERTLAQRVQVAVDASVSRSLEKAGNRLKAAVQSKKSLAALVNTVPAEKVGLILGVEVLTQLNLDETKLISDVLAGQEERYLQWVSDAQHRGLLRLAGDLEWQPTRAPTVLNKLREPRERSWAALASAITLLTRQRLFERLVEPEVGEWDATLLVPMGFIRSALLIAGGHTEFVPTSTLAPPTGATFPGGAVFGEVVNQELLQDGVQVTKWVWSYGSVPRTPFPPHAVLDGVTVEGPADGRLINQSGFPRFGAYYPGDHPGCVCACRPVLAKSSVR